MNKSDTPETDQFKIKLKTTCGEKYWVPIDHSRLLERERNDLKKMIKIIVEDKDDEIKRITIERDSAREVYKTLHKLYTDEIMKNRKLEGELLKQKIKYESTANQIH